ncbi:peroxiredoxin Q/BCP [Methanohalophilus levihalophilus]|uniref:thioredoxin-dependent thiol peroxidase n=1 Tax=Methanohalophilus levihalophilus TaxID=1431282 RepID=UPI001AEAD612|nr:thioredoxin-dependent thiol peroxidase [Methanohalophilus levihalophilus]MBP2029581.1 peroxiredoxin Q/BCP [Methanohalophilus levihalophilus]
MSKSSIIEGQEAPEFCLPDQDGDQVCLNDFNGKWVVLYFYPKDNTQGCTLEAMAFTGLENKFKERNAVILGVSKDSTASHQRFREKKELTITLLSDEKVEVNKLYDVWQLKKMAGKEYMGTVRTTFLIDPDGKVANVWNKVRAKGHAEDVLETLIDVSGN